MSNVPNPSYFKVVEPILREHDGNASALLNAYPNFDSDAVPEDTWGDPYLFQACYLGHFHAVRGLLACNTRLLYTDKFGTTALQIACGLTPDAKEKVTLVTWFLSEHADVRITLNWADVVGGHTALHCAASCNSNAVVRVLLAHGANPTLANKKGHTPARLARRYSRGIGTAELLEKAERAHAVHALGEWRPRSHVRFPRGYRVAMRTLVVLAKARTPAPEDASELRSHYPRACLDLLPEELLQYLFAYITAPHVPDVWTT